MTNGSILGLLVAVAACGDPLVGRGYHGEPLAQVEGRIVDYRLDVREPVALRASLAWSLTGNMTGDPDSLVEQRDVAVSISFPSVFTINVFEEPQSPRLSGLEEPYVVGEIIVYDDVNQDRAYSDGELRGGAEANSLLFAKEALPAESSPTGLYLARGFSLVELPLPCEPGTNSGMGSGNTCGVPLGEACDTHDDCGIRGQCLTNDGYTNYIGGYCVLPATDSCVPDGVELIIISADGEYDTVWVKACEHPSECRDGYNCASWLRACLPRDPVFLEIDEEFEFLPLCEYMLD